MLVGLQNVTFEFGARVIVEDATWHIHPGERIGLIGYNGTGKSTLLKVLVGQYTPSSGTVEKSRETTIGYLHQDLLSFDTNESILEVAMGAFEKIKQLEKEIEQLGKILEQTSDEKLLHDYSDKLHDLEVLGGYTIHHRTEEVLHGLGFAAEDMNKPYKQFSGGWRMRVLLAKMILQQPDVLLLDEPTNHLDLPSIEWLEKYLQHYQGSVVIVSHDKYFLNRMVNKIVELYQQKLHIYGGNYEFYESEKAIRIDLQQKAYENQQDYIRQNERLVERFRAKASKAAMAQSLIKKLDKLDRIEEPEIVRPNLKINFKIETQPGKIICELKNVGKAFGENIILDHADAEINRGDKIALIGANGKGKSTVLRIVAGTEPYTGERNWGHNVVESFYAQHQLEALNLEHNVLEEMHTARSGKTELELRTLLGCFLFSGDDVDKRIKVLSGGEKARVALAKVIVSKANFLLLDEPTNHLDMHSVELLAEALNNYEGSYILVSHDRYFISKTANKIWEIDDHKIKEFKGSYQEYVEWKERMEKQKSKDQRKDQKNKEQGTRNAEQGTRNAEQGTRNLEQKNKEQGTRNVEVKAVQSTNDHQQRPSNNDQPSINLDRDQKKELQRLQRQFQKAEEEVNKKNKKKADLEAELGKPDSYADHQRFLALENDYKKVMQELAVANAEYEKLFEKLMAMGGL